MSITTNPHTAERQLMKRANDFYGIPFATYILDFIVLKQLPNGAHYVWLNDNAPMQRTFAVWLAHDGREQRVIDYLKREQEQENNWTLTKVE